jgi:thiosulfate sulfurtransferase
VRNRTEAPGTFYVLRVEPAMVWSKWLPRIFISAFIGLSFIIGRDLIRATAACFLLLDQRMPEFQTISATDAKLLFEARKTHLLDIRDEHTFEAAHIAGAQRIDNSNIAAFIEAADKNEPLIVVCYHGISSQHAAQFLAAQGFVEVYSLSGGFEDWQRTFPGAIA